MSRATTSAEDASFCTKMKVGNMGTDKRKKSKSSATSNRAFYPSQFSRVLCDWHCLCAKENNFFKEAFQKIFLIYFACFEKEDHTNTVRFPTRSVNKTTTAQVVCLARVSVSCKGQKPNCGVGKVSLVWLGWTYLPSQHPLWWCLLGLWAQLRLMTQSDQKDILCHITSHSGIKLGAEGSFFQSRHCSSTTSACLLNMASICPVLLLAGFFSFFLFFSFFSTCKFLFFSTSDPAVWKWVGWPDGALAAGWGQPSQDTRLGEQRRQIYRESVNFSFVSPTIIICCYNSK